MKNGGVTASKAILQYVYCRRTGLKDSIDFIAETLLKDLFKLRCEK